MHHIPFTTWAVILTVAVGALAGLRLYAPVRRRLPRVAGCLGAGALAATAVTAWADKNRHAALAAAAARPAAHKVSTDGSLVVAFVVITLVVATIAFTIMTVRGRRRPRSGAGVFPGRRVRAW